MKFFQNILVILATVAASTTFAGQVVKLPMPPTFTEQVAPEKILRTYPLGSITKQAALVHHGKAIRTLTLPNGKEGWVYEAGIKQARTYLHPTKEKETVYETVPDDRKSTYTLVFDDKGVVIDVLYNEQGRHDGLTALQEQRKARAEAIGKNR